MTICFSTVVGHGHIMNVTWEKNLTNHVAFSTLKILDCVFAGHLSCQSSDVNAVNQIQQFPLLSLIFITI